MLLFDTITRTHALIIFLTQIKLFHRKLCFHAHFICFSLTHTHTFIHLGTDSRIGFGYRFGDHADFQVQFEIGPQKETQPIGTSESQRKRYIRPADENELERAMRKEKVIYFN